MAAASERRTSNKTSRSRSPSNGSSASPSRSRGRQASTTASRSSARTPSRSSAKSRSTSGRSSSRSSSARSNTQSRGQSAQGSQSQGQSTQSQGQSTQGTGGARNGKPQGSDNGNVAATIGLSVLTGAIGVAGGVLLGRTRLQRQRKILGIPVPGKIDVDLGGLTQQIGEAGRQFGKLAGEVRSVRERAEQIGKALT